MKKILIILIMLSLSLFAVKINKSKTYTKMLYPKNKTSSFIVYIENSSLIYIKDQFEEISNIVKKSGICTSGSYSIDNTNLGETKSSSLFFNCKFEDENTYKTLLKDIKVFEVNISKNPIEYSSIKDLKQKGLLELEGISYSEAKKHIEYLNEHFKNCFIENIYFKKDPSSETINIQNNNTPLEIKLDVEYIFKCD